MPIYPLPQFEADLAEQDRELYERLKPPSSVVVRFGVMKMVGEFPYDGEQKPGCGSKLVVRTQRGTEIGEMLTSTCPNAGCSKSVTRKEMLQYIENSGGKDYPFFSMQGRVLRVATAEDMARQNAIDATKPELTMSARRAVAELKLNMKVVEAEPLLGGERLTFYFASEDRIDFRELVNRLAAEHKTRIELRQVGARDEARLVADYEKCGQHCCCKQFLKVLKPISMKAAKIQKATLDPLKISGRCGRLMCCLRYEDQTYDDLRKRLPKKKTRVLTPHGPGLVLDTQILTQLVLVLLDNSDEQVAVAIEELTMEGGGPVGGGAGGSAGSSASGGSASGGSASDRSARKGGGQARAGDDDEDVEDEDDESAEPARPGAAGAMAGSGAAGGGGGSTGITTLGPDGRRLPREPELGVRRAREASGMLPTPVSPGAGAGAGRARGGAPTGTTTGGSAGGPAGASGGVRPPHGPGMGHGLGAGARTDRRGDRPPRPDAPDRRAGGPGDRGPREAGSREGGPRDQSPRGQGSQSQGPREQGQQGQGRRDAGPRSREDRPREDRPRDRRGDRGLRDGGDLRQRSGGDGTSPPPPTAFGAPSRPASGPGGPAAGARDETSMSDAAMSARDRDELSAPRDGFDQRDGDGDIDDGPDEPGFEGADESDAPESGGDAAPGVRGSGSGPGAGDGPGAGGGGGRRRRRRRRRGRGGQGGGGGGSPGGAAGGGQGGGGSPQ